VGCCVSGALPCGSACTEFYGFASSYEEDEHREKRMHVTWPRSRVWSDVNWPCDSFYRHRFTFHTDISAERTLAAYKSRTRKLQQCVSRQKEGRARERGREREKVRSRVSDERRTKSRRCRKQEDWVERRTLYIFLPPRISPLGRKALS